MLVRALRLAVLFVAPAFVLTACSTGDDDDVVSSGDGGAGTDASPIALPACGYASGLADAGGAGGLGAVLVTRTYLACGAAGGAGEDCPSDDPNTCGEEDGTGVTFSPCRMLCAADEYAVSYGGPPQTLPDGASEVPTAPTLPSGCHSVLAGPGGGETSCCPCD